MPEVVLHTLAAVFCFVLVREYFSYDFLGFHAEDQYCYNMSVSPEFLRLTKRYDKKRLSIGILTEKSKHTGFGP